MSDNDPRTSGADMDDPLNPFENGFDLPDSLEPDPE